jgi:stearoyl-CoA desaturase (delta-9 desaturase)
MKIKLKKYFSMKLQVNTLRIICHIIAIYGLASYPVNTGWLILSVFGYFLFTRIGADIGFHRYFTHRSFKTTYFFEKILFLLGLLDCKGSLYSWVISHVAHHKFSDSIGDPHSPHRIGFYGIWLSNWEPFATSRKEITTYIYKPIFRITHDYYFFFVIAFIITLGIVSSKILIFGYCIPMVYSMHMTAIVNYIGHSWGYKNFDTNDKSRNSLLINILSLGGGLHNNHHWSPQNYNQATNYFWHEFDPAAIVIKLIKVN